MTYEPQWGSDVFAMYQNLVEGREVPRSLLTKDFPADHHDDNKYTEPDLVKTSGQHQWQSNRQGHDDGGQAVEHAPEHCIKQQEQQNQTHWG